MAKVLRRRQTAYARVAIAAKVIGTANLGEMGRLVNNNIRAVITVTGARLGG